MKASIVHFFLVATCCAALEAPSSFLREPSTDKKEERQLLGSPSCPVESTWKTEIQAVYDSNADPQIQELASQALRILTDEEYDEIPEDIQASDDNATALRGILDDFDIHGMLSTLRQLRRRATLALLFSPEHRLSEFGEVAQDLSSVLSDVNEMLNTVLFAVQYVIALNYFRLLDTIEAIKSGLVVLIAGLPVVIALLFGGDGEIIVQAVETFVDVFFTPMIALLSLTAVVLYGILEVARLVLFDGKRVRGPSRQRERVECALTRIMEKLPSTVTSLAKAQDYFTTLEVEP